MTQRLLTLWLVALFGSSIQNTLASSTSWTKIHHPNTTTSRALGNQGIHYENFVWLESSTAEQLNNGERTSVINQPFHHNVDGVMLDLNQDSLPQNPWYATPELTQKDLFLVQFKGPIKSSWLEQLSQDNIKLISPLAPFSWIVWADESQLNAITEQAQVRYWSYFYSGFRVSVDDRQLPHMNTTSMALLVAEVKDQAIVQLESLGADIEHQGTITDHLFGITFSLPGDNYLAASQVPGVMTVQEVALDGGPRGEMSQQSIIDGYDGIGSILPGYQTWLDDTGLDGSGVTVSVVDGGIYQNHPDLTNVVQCTVVPGTTSASCGDSSDTHGTHVAGAIGGTGVNGSLNAAGFNRGLGVAPGVQIVEQLYGPMLGGGPGGMIVDGMLSIYKDAQISGSMLSNNSWGPTGSPQGYDIPTMEIDIISRDANPDVAGNQPVLAVWSIMNGGGDSFGSCSPSSLGSPDEAKNLFAVGSTALQNNNATQAGDVFDVSSNSAHGPACDGRLVPHIVAPGCRTESATTSSGYGLACGTSMASPVMSGAISLFWEQYRIEYGTDPSPALVKAVFTAVADDLEGQNDADGNVMDQAPNRQQGWGRVNLENVINNQGVWLLDQTELFTMTGQNWQQTLSPINPNEPIRMMLVWTDAPGAGLGGTNPAWVNDLDLSVVADNNTYLGNEFGVDGYSATGGTADLINNMEGVFLSAAQHAGEDITIEVLASNISGDALNPHGVVAPQQDFALACFNCQPAVVVGNDIIFSDGFDVFIDLIFEDGFE